MAAYKMGNGIVLSAKFTYSDGRSVDPTTVSFVIKKPNGTLTTYVFGVATNINQLALGQYECYITPDVRGKWRWKAVGSGNMDAIEEKDFDIIPTST